MLWRFFSDVSSGTGKENCQLIDERKLQINIQQQSDNKNSTRNLNKIDLEKGVLFIANGQIRWIILSLCIIFAKETLPLIPIHTGLIKCQEFLKNCKLISHSFCIICNFLLFVRSRLIFDGQLLFIAIFSLAYPTTEVWVWTGLNEMRQKEDFKLWRQSVYSNLHKYN